LTLFSISELPTMRSEWNIKQFNGSVKPGLNPERPDPCEGAVHRCEIELIGGHRFDQWQDRARAPTARVAAFNARCFASWV
jgi:hypothetical protein